jgi:DNA-binding transcriptional regulator YiaG
MEASELKRQLARARSEKRGAYPSALRDAVIAYAAKRRAEKIGRDRVAAELGMSVATLSYWCSPPAKTGKLAAVSIVRAPAEREVVVECGPLRVRGLDVGSVAELLRSLA